MCGMTSEFPGVQQYSGLWLQCDECCAWLHGACVGYPRRPPKGKAFPFRLETASADRLFSSLLLNLPCYFMGRSPVPSQAVLQTLVYLLAVLFVNMSYSPGLTFPLIWIWCSPHMQHRHNKRLHLGRNCLCCIEVHPKLPCSLCHRCSSSVSFRQT